MEVFPVPDMGITDPIGFLRSHRRLALGPNFEKFLSEADSKYHPSVQVLSREMARFTLKERTTEEMLQVECQGLDFFICPHVFLYWLATMIRLQSDGSAGGPLSVTPRGNLFFVFYRNDFYPVGLIYGEDQWDIELHFPKFDRSWGEGLYLFSFRY